MWRPKPRAEGLVNLRRNLCSEMPLGVPTESQRAVIMRSSSECTFCTMISSSYSGIFYARTVARGGNGGGGRRKGGRSIRIFCMPGRPPLEDVLAAGRVLRVGGPSRRRTTPRSRPRLSSLPGHSLEAGQRLLRGGRATHRGRRRPDSHGRRRGAVPGSTGSVDAQESGTKPNSTSRPPASLTRRSARRPQRFVRTTPASSPTACSTQPSSPTYGPASVTRRTMSRSESIVASRRAQEPTMATPRTSGLSLTQPLTRPTTANISELLRAVSTATIMSCA